MPATFGRELRRILARAGCSSGREREVTKSDTIPISNRLFVLPAAIVSRHSGERGPQGPGVVENLLTAAAQPTSAYPAPSNDITESS